MKLTPENADDLQSVVVEFRLSPEHDYQMMVTGFYPKRVVGDRLFAQKLADSEDMDAIGGAIKEVLESLLNGIEEQKR